MRTLESIKFAVAQGKARRDDAHKMHAEYAAQAQRLAEEAVATKKAQTLLQEVAAHVQHDLEHVIENSVQGCLDLLFPGYTFKVDFIPRRGKTEAELLICKDGARLDPLTSSGGGVVDAVCFALRTGCLHLAGKRQMLVLDEPFKHLRDGEVVKPRKELGRVLSVLAEKMGVQVLMVGDVAGTDINADREYSF